MNSVVAADYSIPANGDVTEVAPGVLWLRMPLPFDLDHMNLYLLDDIDGWVVVDCGLGNTDSQDVWERVATEFLNGKPIKKVIVTHAHIDHIGAAGWLCRRWNVPLWITAGELQTGQEYFHASEDSVAQLRAEKSRFLHRMGMSSEQSAGVVDLSSSIATLVQPLPVDQYEIQDGMKLEIGNRQWRVIVSEGHSVAHASLYCEALGVLISGDQVLPRISSNVSVRVDNPEGNPLLSWLHSLERMKELPEQTLVLPAHEYPFHGLRQRLSELDLEHRDMLTRIEQACTEPQTVMQLVAVIYRRKLSLFDQLLAGGECLAHLHYLLAEQRIRREEGSDGCLRFTR
ncbi:MBL fold metallo-hydrolase [Amphritea sp. HPY]|uniref:MBL fold metallo-hydrolase n=1 Tax=Amphritea sp. HPY TaxID=3421652 RepID=UPI003D7CA5F8